MSKTRLTDQEIDAVAQQFAVEAKLLKAVSIVESGGNGFLSDGRLKILFERHYMRKRLLFRGIDPTPLSTFDPTLCNSKPGGYGKGGAKQWDRIQMILDWANKHAPTQFESYKKAAYESSSWGAFQIMGANYSSVGFENVYDLKHHLEVGNKEQLETICHWMESNGLLARLKAKDWAGFALGYNGTNYKVNHYDTKLENAYRTA